MLRRYHHCFLQGKCVFLCHLVALFLLMMATVGMAALPELGRFQLMLNSSREYDGFVKNVYNSTRVSIQVSCSSEGEDQKVLIGWVLKESQCWNEYAFAQSQREVFRTLYEKPEVNLLKDKKSNDSDNNFVKVKEIEYDCVDVIVLQDVVGITDWQNITNASNLIPDPFNDTGPESNEGSQFKIEREGEYFFIIHIVAVGSDAAPFRAVVDVAMKGDHGYLGITDWPLLPFYGVMCGVYVCFGLGWLSVCAMHFRDLLRIQFWIAGVIFLGMLEKAMFYAEFQNVNTLGTWTRGLILAAELVSCAKRTLARMLVIIVSLGFGIVKPRLGATLHRIVAFGFLYFILAFTESYLRVIKPKNDVSTGMMLAGIPLAVVDSAICWWVFSALVQTTRTLRLRRNLIKLSLYRNFANVLILAVFSSVIFMMWSVKYHKLEDCLKDWHNLWLEDAFWHILFSCILLCIMILWSPSMNNQRYAFTPLLDNEEDEESEEETFFSDAFEGVKQRMVAVNGKKETNDADEEIDPLKWIEENIPQTADMENPLPVIDSDEEIETTKFEISKMQ